MHSTFRCGPLAGLLLLACLTSSASAGDRQVILSASDILVPTGKAASLRIKLERKGFGFASKSRAIRSKGLWRADLPNRQVRFFLDGVMLGQVITDGEGEASLTWTPPEAGEYRIEARFAGDKKYAAGTDELFVVSAPATAPLVILDVDHTLTHTSNKNVIKGSIADPPLEHSPQVVPRLQEKYGVIYVSARANKFLDVTKRWLAHYGYPRRPLYMLDIKDYPTYNEAKYKIDVLTPMKADFPKMWLGVGDKDSDAEAYRALGLRSLILGDAGGVAGAEEVPDWHEVERLLFDPRREKFRDLSE